MRLAIMQGESAVLDAATNLSALRDAAVRAGERGGELLLSPELFPVGYAPRVLRRDLDPASLPSLREELAAIARDTGIALLYSLPEVEGGKWHITATLLSAEGTVLSHYRKVHLFGAEEQEVFTPGTDPAAVVRFGDLTLGTIICYDVEFPEAVRAAGLQGVDLLMVPTALGEGYSQVPQRLIPTRAMENHLYLAYVNHAGVEDGFRLSGGSVVADPFGELLAEGGPETELMIVDVDPARLAAARADVPYLAERRPDLYRAWGL
ncbi:MULTISPECIES: carbon-nitrogen hydrolase family protein [Arthrobacter]|uniref:Carbon-nitrogen hydrolase family protein n=2 Tax=Arthrobacter TaxID=1663 RepID=A0ABU9KKN6_9MICC|nr:carbon-nitrogen hydrolase family protein [Arthrobacter sp. YJM1]MDP5227465.1 carbon-nitrogen hydrolase family protein [Arthrobacter sp. YJM1]